MDGTSAQALALTVAGNAFLQGWDIGPFWPESEAFAFCDRVSFASTDGTIAANPEEWMELLRRDSAGLRLRVVPHNRGGMSDLQGLPFANGGPRWLVEASCPSEVPIFWEPEWSLSRDPIDLSDEGRGWSVTYRRLAEAFDFPGERPIPVILVQLGETLDALAALVEHAAPEQAMPGWAANFRNARRLVDQDEGRHRRGDPEPAGFLSRDAYHLLHVCGAAWVFGGMGAWNDGAYWGTVEAEGDRLSESLFSLLKEGVAAAANSITQPA